MSDEKLKDLRGGVARMREVAQLLNGWADEMERSLEKTEEKPVEKPTAKPGRKAGKKAEAAETGEPVAETKPADAIAPEAVTAEQVRSILAAKCAAGFKTQVQALINSFGAAKFSGVAPEHWPALLEAVQGLGVDADAG